MQKNNFLSILDITSQDIQAFLDRGVRIKKNRECNAVLKDKSMIMLFEKASTRTRVSFEVAIKELGGDSLFMTPQESQMGRSEPLKDTARVLSRYAHAMIVRTFAQENLQELAHYSQVPVFNALSDMFHPCQVISDVLTIFERTPDFSGLKIAWIGDGNNMANSWLNMARLLPIELYVATPRAYEPNREVMQDALDNGARITLTHDPVQAVKDAAYINTDVWSSMGQDKDAKTIMQYFLPYQVNEELLRHAPAQARVMHCLPAYRGKEISEEVLEGPRSIVWDQAENRLHMQKVLLERFMSEEGKSC